MPLTIFDKMLIFTAFIDVALGIFSLIKKRDKTGVVFFAITLSLALWAVALFMTHHASRATLNFWTNFCFFGPSLLAGFLLYFTYLFPAGERAIAWIKKIILIFLPLVVFSLLSLLQLINVESYSATHFKRTPFYYFFTAYFLIWCIFTLKRLHDSYKKYRGIRKLQVKYVFLGILFGLISGGFFNLLLPLFGFSYLNRLGPVFSGLFFCVFMTYGITRYRLLDIKIVFKKSFIYFLLILIIFAICTFLILSLGRLFQDIFGLGFITTASLSAFLIALLFQPLRNIITRGMDETIFPYQPLRAIDGEIIREFQRSTDLAQLGGDIHGLLKKSLRISECYFFVLDKRGQVYRLEFITHRQARETISFAVNDPFIAALLKERKIVVNEEIPFIIDEAGEERGGYLALIGKILSKFDFSAVVPLISGEEIIGFFFLGEKLNGSAFTVQDVKFLEEVKEAGAYLLTNVLSYKYAMEGILKGGILS